MAEPADENPAPPPPRVINLAQFLKFQGEVETGGQAKQLIQAGQVSVNGEVETRRGRKLRTGDRVRVGQQEHIV